MVSECVLHSHANLWPVNTNGPNNPSCTHSTPHTRLNVTYWHCVDEHVIFCRQIPVILRVRASTHVKPSYIVGERVWVFPSRTPWSYQLAKFSFFRDLWTTNVFYGIKCNSSVVFRTMTQTCPFAAQVKQAIFNFWKCLIWHQFCLVLPQLVRIFCVFSCCLKLKAMLKTLSRTGKLSCLKLSHHANFV